MAEIGRIPLWLNLKKEYIDDNIDALQTYLQQSSNNKEKDEFYGQTVELLRSRIDELLLNLSERPIFKEDDQNTEVLYNIRLLTLYLLVEDDNERLKTAYVALMGELRFLHPKLSDCLISNAMECLKHQQIGALGFSWRDLANINTELFCFNVCHNAQFLQYLTNWKIYANVGTAFLTKDGLFLIPESSKKAVKLLSNGTNSIDTAAGIVLRTSSNDKLKTSKVNDIDSMFQYVKDLEHQLKNASAPLVRPKVKSYSLNDEATVCITSIRNKVMYVETVDPGYEKLSGVMTCKAASLVYYYTNSFCEYFKEGDCFKANVANLSKPIFYIDNQFVAFVVEGTREMVDDNPEFVAQVIDVKENYYAWINECGVAIFTSNNGEYEKGDFATLQVTGFDEGEYYGKIYAKLTSKIPSCDFSEKTVRKELMRLYAEDVGCPQKRKADEDIAEMDPKVLKLLSRQVFAHQKTLLKPSERFRFLVNAYVMAVMTGDTLSASYIKFGATYLRALVQFVHNEDVKSLILEPDETYKSTKPVLLRLGILEILQEYGRKEHSPKLAQAIEDFKDSIPMLARLAQLVQTANTIQESLPGAALNVIKREIIKTLSIETEGSADLDDDNAVYLGIESGTQEFKTSMIFPPNNNMQPDEGAQNTNVLKGICAFLNSTIGGVLYIGVNDQGYAVGVENDMEYLHLMTIDSYTRYIQDTAKRALGIDAIQFVRIEPLYDNTIVAVHVNPHRYRVVELDGKAYIRINNESREMPDKMRLQLISEKLLTNTDEAAAISQLQHACYEKKNVILHNYASSNSGIVSDRLVEAYDIRVDDKIVVCYDLEEPSPSKKVKMFNISRIGYVEILDDPWSNIVNHVQVKFDAFHMTGSTSMHVSLQLDLLAKNLLVEGYPATKNDLTADKKDVNIWYYDAVVYSLEGIARFYMGLADHVKVIKAPELMTFVADFVKKHLQH